MTGTTVLLFPGQGVDATEVVKSGRWASQEVYDVSRQVLGFDVSRLTLAQLRKTQVLQPAVVARGLDGVEKLAQERPDLLTPETNLICAGFSVGEITALAAARILSKQDALLLVRERAKAMQLASDQGPKGKMITLFDVNSNETLPLGIAGRLFPGCCTVAGPERDVDSVKWVPQYASSFKVQNVSGAFHTNQMDPAAEVIRNLKTVIEVKKASPNVTVISNVTASPYAKDDDVLDVLARQVVSAVEWERTLELICDLEGPVTIVTIGPGKQMESMFKRMSRKPKELCEMLHY